MGMDGSQVWPAYQEGRIDEIRRYCETDVVNTYLMYCRFQLMRGGFSSEEYKEEIAFVKAYLEKESKEPHGEQWQEYLLGFTPDA
jgi:predicted PolB exonuclease-like 3'-5' exonuclease